MIEYIVYGEESGEIETFKTLKEAQDFIKSIIKFDKRHGFISDNYYIEKIEWKNGKVGFKNEI